MKSNVTQIKFQEVKVNPASSKLSLLLALKGASTQQAMHSLLITLSLMISH